MADAVESAVLMAITEQFVTLKRKVKRIFGDRFKHDKLDRQALLNTQREMFYLAQAICMRIAPDVQREVDTIRREIMQEHVAPAVERMLQKQSNDSSGNARFTPGKVKGSIIADWTRVDITPGVANNQSLAGIRIPRRLVWQLRQAINKQVETVSHHVDAFLA